jgi:C4-dicarboxylate transporter
MFYMGTLLISALATACVLSAVEAFLFSLNKWRGLLGLALSTIFCLLLGVSLKELVPFVLASTFAGLTLSLMVEQIFIGIPKGNLPKRIPPR